MQMSFLQLNILTVQATICNFHRKKVGAGNTKGGSITVLLTSCFTGLESAQCLLTIFVFICKTD